MFMMNSWNQMLSKGNESLTVELRAVVKIKLKDDRCKAIVT